MRLTYLIILLIFLLSCNRKEKKTGVFESGKYYPEVEQRSVIIGQIENINEFSNVSKTITLKVDDNSIDHQSLFITTISDSGRFVFDIPLYHSTNTFLEYCDGTELPYLFTNDTIYLNC